MLRPVSLRNLLAGAALAVVLTGPYLALQASRSTEPGSAATAMQARGTAGDAGPQLDPDG